jgi:hypothetical protein
MSIHFPGTERDAKPWRRLEAVIALSMADLESKRVMLSHCGRLQAACRALRGAMRKSFCMRKREIVGGVAHG